jgi:carbonic anhydrase/acetyltransferase-like protein (isoleucine patch superfamily)
MILCRLLVMLIPWWPLKRYILQRAFGYRIHPQARIGFAYIYPQDLYMGKGSQIGHATVCKGLTMLWMGEHSLIGRLNWISAIPKSSKATFFSGQSRRDPRLVLGAHAAVTNRHLIDCSDKVVIGKYTTVAGFSSQLLTHSIDINLSKQISSPINIGAYCFIGSRAILLPGSSVPFCSVVAAGAVVCEKLTNRFSLYAGVPARFVKRIRTNALYFTRSSGYIT